jgi:hypothetical protein
MDAGMKFYDEQRMQAIREALEATILRWPGVTSKPMMGCLVYFRGSRFFAFLVTGAIVITKLSGADRARLAKVAKVTDFEMTGTGSKRAVAWPRVAVTQPGDVRALLPFVRQSYAAAAGATTPR